MGWFCPITFGLGRVGRTVLGWISGGLHHEGASSILHIWGHLDRASRQTCL